MRRVQILRVASKRSRNRFIFQTLTPTVWYQTDAKWPWMVVFKLLGVWSYSVGVVLLIMWQNEVFWLVVATAAADYFQAFLGTTLIFDWLQIPIRSTDPRDFWSGIRSRTNMSMLLLIFSEILCSSYRWTSPLLHREFTTGRQCRPKKGFCPLLRFNSRSGRLTILTLRTLRVFQATFYSAVYISFISKSISFTSR